MARYRKVDTRIWADEKYRLLSDDGKFAFLFVLTHPHLMAIGAMRGTLNGLAAELRWTPKRFRTAITPAIQCGMVEVNEAASYIALPNFLRYNEPEGPNSVKKAWLAALDSVPECFEKRTLIVRCRKYLDEQSAEFRDQLGPAVWEAFTDAMADAIPDAYRDASSIQEQEPEQEPEQEQKPEKLASGSPPVAVVSVDAFEEFYLEYPKKRAKEAARKAWTKLAPNAALVETIMAALALHKTSEEWLRTQGRFIPYPATWLNNKRWEDGVGPNNGGARAGSAPNSLLAVGSITDRGRRNLEAAKLAMDANEKRIRRASL